MLTAFCSWGQQAASNPYYRTYTYTNPWPTFYTRPELAKKLSERLSPEELKLVVDPLVITPQMAAFARELIAGATNDAAKSRLIFDALARRQEKIGPTTRGILRTARDVFAEWNNCRVAFSCWDNALLYIALTRSVGITAFDVDVQESMDGSKAPHNCAFVIIDGNGILVDPAYLYYGIRHRQFTILDDLQLIALYMIQLPDLESSKIAAKLAPDLLLVQENYFAKLVSSRSVAEALQMLPTIKRLDGNSTVTAYAEGSVAVCEGRTGVAISRLNQAIAENPHVGDYYYQLANAYAQDSRFDDAREALRASLSCDIFTNEVDAIQQMISNTNTLKLWGYTSRGAAMMVQRNLPEAIKSYEQTVTIEPQLSYVYHLLGILYFNCHELQKALTNFDKAGQMDPSDPYLRFQIWLIRSRLGEKTAANEELRTFLNGRESQFPNDWQSKIRYFLLGELSDKELFEAADNMNTNEDEGYNCEALFYAGEKQLVSGDKSIAKSYFKKCVGTKADNEPEYLNAVAELQALDK